MGSGNDYTAWTRLRLGSCTKDPGVPSSAYAYSSKPGFLQHHNNLVTTEQQRGQTASPAPEPPPHVVRTIGPLAVQDPPPAFSPAPDAKNWPSCLHLLCSLARLAADDSDWQTPGLVLGPAEPSGADGTPGISEVTVPEGRRETSYWNPRARAGPARGARGALSELAAANGGRGAAGGAEARRPNVLIAGARGRGRAGGEAAHETVRCWEPSPWPGAGLPEGALGSGRGGWVWGRNPAHPGYWLSGWLHSSNIRRRL